MAEGINVCTFVGRAVRNIELRKSERGMTVGKFSLAVNERNDGVSFFDFVMFDKFAEQVGKYVTKGKRLAVSGRAKQNTWTDKDTHKLRSKVEFIVNGLELLDGGQSEAQRTEDMFKADSSEEFEDGSAF
jgi:single-strand DNA-binding protein